MNIVAGPMRRIFRPVRPAMRRHCEPLPSAASNPHRLVIETFKERCGRAQAKCAIENGDGVQARTMPQYTGRMQGPTKRNRRQVPGSLTSRELDERIHSTVRQIPRGKVAAYGWIAERAGVPRGARRVGRALRTLPSARRIPWHRVVNAQGRISFPKGSATARKQRELLMAEGVIFHNQRIDLKRFGWRQSLDEYLWQPP